MIIVKYEVQVPSTFVIVRQREVAEIMITLSLINNDKIAGNYCLERSEAPHRLDHKSASRSTYLKVPYSRSTSPHSTSTST